MPSERGTRRTHTFVVKTPPTIGPRMDERPKTAPNKPKYIGRFRSGTVLLMITTAPVKVPAAPIPVMARPNMKARDDGAAAQTTLPTSKITTSTRNTHFPEKKV